MGSNAGKWGNDQIRIEHNCEWIKYVSSPTEIEKKCKNQINQIEEEAQEEY